MSCICCLQVYINCFSGGFRSIDIADTLRTSHLYSISSDKLLLRTKKTGPFEYFSVALDFKNSSNSMRTLFSYNVKTVKVFYKFF